ncbi:hypothetical protein HYH03_000602 [Edaphochlamys debaryana]|uniref:Uncharacterized protein n=1 Tax=Edaphochlamys debaryana TaxID=47281 RepID=A0A835YFZ9_9CHLO|nr:hypothetical protein HYH03_000602 [Edaphochlamys debaryana]|eukprot:KAG2502110.1 hypothetical protein HYH03_000602 [Edaphochlamys debaryana]
MPCHSGHPPVGAAGRPGLCNARAAAPRPPPQLIIMRLDKADTPSQAVELLRKSKASSAATSAMTFLHIAGLRALARCYAPKEARSKLVPRSNEMYDLQDCVRDAATELHARLGLLSYSQLSDALASLAVLLPLAQWPLCNDRLLPELAAALPAAAAAADRVSPVPLPELCSGLVALRDLAIAGRTRGWPSAGPAMAAAANYLRRDLYGSQDVKKRLGSADMAGLCAAVELAALFDVDPGPSFVASACGRMSRLLAEATEAGIRAELDRAAAARIEAKAQETAQSDGDDSHTGEPEGDGSSSTASRRKGEGAPGSRKRTRGVAPTAAKHQPFDVTSLARALTAWCHASPQHAAPSDAWLQAHAAAVLRAYDPATGDRRWELACKLEKAQRGLRFLKAEPAGKGPGSKKAGKPNPPAGGAASDTEGDVKGGAPASRRHSRRKEGRGAEGAAAVSAPPAAKAPVPEVKADKDAASLARLEAEVTSLTAQIKALGPVVSSDLMAPPAGLPAPKQKQAPPLSGPWRADGMVFLLVGLGTRLGPRAGEEVGRLAEAALAAHLVDIAPSQLVAALTALAMLQHRPSAELLPFALRRLAPALGKLQGQDGNRLLRALRSFDYTPPASARDGIPSAATLLSSLSVDLSSTDDLVIFLRSCQQWHVPYPRLEALQASVEQRVLRELPPDRVSTLSARAQMVAKDVAPKAGIHTPAPESDGSLRSQLLFGVLLPLAALRQAFANPDMLDIALGDWQDKGYPGLDASNAALVLNSFAFNRSWPLVPGFRRELLALMPAALAVPCASPRDLSRLLLAVGRAVRLIADKMQRLKEPDLAAAVAPETAAALLPALERLMALRPSASHLGLAAQGLFVEARRRPTQLQPAADQPGPSATAAGPDAPSRQLLARMLEVARASLAAGTGDASGPQQLGDSDWAASEAGGGKEAGPDTRALAGGVLPLAYLLSACVELRHRPSTDILAVLYEGATEALRRSGASTQVENTVQLLNALSAVERGQGPDGAPAGEPSAAPTKETVAEAGGPGPAAMRRRAQQDAAYQAAKAELLATLALALLQEQSLQALSAQPDALVTSVRQLAVLGLRPEPTWLESYVSTVKDLAPQLSHTGLAYAAEGLALLRAAPPVVVLEVLLAQAEREDLRRFDVFPLGLLLGGVHTLWQNRLREEVQLLEGEREVPTDVKAGSGGAGKSRRRRAARVGQPALPLSDKALNIVNRATALFVSEDRREKVLPRYSQAQLLMVSGAVAALELQRSRERGGRVATADLLGRVEPEWLLECCTSLIQARIASARATARVLAPPPQLVVSLLRLASYTLCGSQDIVRLPRSAAVGAPSSSPTEASRLASEVSAGAAQAVSRYVRLALGDLARESGIKGPKQGKGRASGGSSSTAQGLVPTTSDWATLLEAVLAAGIPLEEPVLAAYASSLFSSVVATSFRPASASEGLSADEAKAEADWEAWEQLCGGMSSLLLRALPWAPAAQQITRLHSGLLDRPEALEGASGGQLALMATYATAVGEPFSQHSWWSTLAAEVRRRGPPPPVAAGAVARQKPQASPAVEAAGTEALAAWGEEYDNVRLCLDDLAVMVYGMDQAGLAGRRVEDAEAWVKQLLEMSAETGATASPAGAPPSEQQLLRALALLWTARRLGRLECVPPRVWAVAFGHTGPSPWPQPAKALPAKQLGQLALLWAEVARAGNPAGLAGPSSDFAADLLVALEAACKQGTHHIEAAEAAAFLLFLSPPSKAVSALYPALVDTAVAGLGAEVPLGDVGPLLERVLALPAASLKSLAERLAAPCDPSDVEPRQSALLTLPAAERAELVRRVLLAAPPSDPSSSEAVLPLLQALLPNADAELYGMAAQERIGPAVLAAALDALEEATIRTDEPAGTAGAVAAASLAARVVERSTELCSKPTAMPTDTVTSLPPALLAPLAAAILTVGGGGRLTGPAAAALLRLLSMEGVPQLVPVAAVWGAMNNALVDAGLPISNATAEAVSARMRLAEPSSTARPEVQGVYRARALRRAGASVSYSRAALLALQRQNVVMDNMAMDQTITVLQELYDCGAVERVSPIQQYIGLLFMDPDRTRGPEYANRLQPEFEAGSGSFSVESMLTNLVASFAQQGGSSGSTPEAATRDLFGPLVANFSAALGSAPGGATEETSAEQALEVEDAEAELPADVDAASDDEGPQPPPWRSADPDIMRTMVMNYLDSTSGAKADARAAAATVGPDPLGPFSVLACHTLEVVNSLLENSWATPAEAVAALELAVKLRRNLPGIVGRRTYWGTSQSIARLALTELSHGKRALLGQDAEVLWRLLEAAHQFGGHAYTDRDYLDSLRASAQQVEGLMVSADAARASGQLADAGRENAAMSGLYAMLGFHYSRALDMGPYTVWTNTVVRLLQKAQPLLERHQKALAQAQATPLPLPPVLPSGDEDPASPLLSTRQLGLLYSALVLRGPKSSVGAFVNLRLAGKEVGDLYRSSLDRLAARTDLPPLAHLTAVLRALEPAVVPNSRAEILPPGFYAKELPVERWLAPPLLRILSGEADKLYGLYGDGPYDLGDVDQAAFERELRSGSARHGPGETSDLLDAVVAQDALLFKAPVHVDGETLVSGLHRVWGTAYKQALLASGGCPNADALWHDGRRKYRLSSFESDARWAEVHLPPWLAPPAGSRHGDGSDPAGDAAREAYARRTGAWVAAARSAVKVALVALRGPKLQSELSSCVMAGAGRWAALCAPLAEESFWSKLRLVARADVNWDLESTDDEEDEQDGSNEDAEDTELGDDGGVSSTSRWPSPLSDGALPSGAAGQGEHAPKAVAPLQAGVAAEAGEDASAASGALQGAAPGPAVEQPAGSGAAIKSSAVAEQAAEDPAAPAAAGAGLAATGRQLAEPEREPEPVQAGDASQVEQPSAGQAAAAVPTEQQDSEAGRAASAPAAPPSVPPPGAPDVAESVGLQPAPAAPQPLEFFGSSRLLVNPHELAFEFRKQLAEMGLKVKVEVEDESVINDPFGLLARFDKAAGIASKRKGGKGFKAPVVLSNEAAEELLAAALVRAAESHAEALEARRSAAKAAGIEFITGADDPEGKEEEGETEDGVQQGGL